MTSTNQNYKVAKLLQHWPFRPLFSYKTCLTIRHCMFCRKKGAEGVSIVRVMPLCNFDSQKWHISIKITKWHNSYTTDPSAPFFLQNMQCLLVKVWWKFKQNQAKPTWVTEQNLKNDIFQSKLQSGITLTILTPSAPFFLQNMQCLMVKVWWKFKQNQAKATRVIEQTLKNDIFKSKLQSGITLTILTPSAPFFPTKHAVSDG